MAWYAARLVCVVVNARRIARGGRYALWIPQLTMVVGCAGFALAMLHALVARISGSTFFAASGADQTSSRGSMEVVVARVDRCAAGCSWVWFVDRAGTAGCRRVRHANVHAPRGDSMMLTIWGSTSSWTLTALPLFLWMGEILFRSKLSSDMFRGLAPWLNRLPGRLLHTNVIGCTIFAAVSGSSAATCATIGKNRPAGAQTTRLSR